MTNKTSFSQISSSVIIIYICLFSNIFSSIISDMINASLSTIIYLISILSQIYVKICFTFDSYLLYLALFLCYISLLQLNVIYKSTCLENYIPAVMPPLNPTSPPFSQHVSWRCCNPPGIPSSMAEILLFNSVFHDGVDPVSVSTLKLPLGVIGVVTLKPRASPILPLCI